MKYILTSIAALGLYLAPARAAGELDKVSFGETIANGPITKEDLKGKVVVVELWGIH